MIYIIDSWAWVEYFIGSKSGLNMKNLLNNKNNKFITLECTVSELKSYCLRTGYDFGIVRSILKKNSIILPVLASHWLEAAEIKHEMRKKSKDFGLIDAILAAKQKEINCNIVSGDPHFMEFKKVAYIGPK
jgi:predicted nucleic acid-binding protein